MSMARQGLEVRKPIDALTPEDLTSFPIWEFASDEEDVDEERDETWVRPVDATVVELDQWSLSVAADFQLSSGTTFPGFISVTTADETELGPGVLLAGGKYLFASAKKDAERAAVAEALGRSVAEVFPLTFTLRVLISGETKPRSGTLK
jgi:hypothetical protein